MISPLQQSIENKSSQSEAYFQSSPFEDCLYKFFESFFNYIYVFPDWTAMKWLVKAWNLLFYVRWYKSIPLYIQSQNRRPRAMITDNKVLKPMTSSDSVSYSIHVDLTTGPYRTSCTLWFWKITLYFNIQVKKNYISLF